VRARRASSLSLPMPLQATSDQGLCAPLPAGGPEQRVNRGAVSVLTGEPGHRGVGDRFDVALEREVEERGDRLDVAVDRARRAFCGGELDPGADRAEVGVFDELRVRQGDREGADVGVAGAACRGEGIGGAGSAAVGGDRAIARLRRRSRRGRRGLRGGRARAALRRRRLARVAAGREEGIPPRGLGLCFLAALLQVNASYSSSSKVAVTSSASSIVTRHSPASVTSSQPDHSTALEPGAETALSFTSLPGLTFGSTPVGPW